MDNWASARQQFEDEMLPYLRKHGKRIGELSDSGDANAVEIIRLYTLLYRSFDPLFFMALQDALTRFKKAVGAHNKQILETQHN